MHTGINVHETFKYVSKTDPDKAAPTVFHLGFLDSNLKEFVDEQTTSVELSSKNPGDRAKVNVQVMKRNILAVKFGVRGMDSFLDPQTKQPAKFDPVSVSVNGKNYPAVSEPLLSMLSKKLIDELAEVILAENTLSEEEVKN